MSSAARARRAGGNTPPASRSRRAARPQRLEPLGPPVPSQAHAPRATRTAVRASPRRAAAGSTQRSGSGSGPNDPAPPGLSVTAFPNPAAEEPSVDARAEPPAALSLIGAVMWETLQPNANCCHECCRNATRTLLWVCVMVLMVGGGPFLVLFCISFVRGSSRRCRLRSWRSASSFRCCGSTAQGRRRIAGDGGLGLCLASD